MIDDLYSAEILRRAANMPHAGRLRDPMATASHQAKLCGSRVTVDVVVRDGVVCDFAQEVKACALGQAAAAILGSHVIGAQVDALIAARDGLRALLKEENAPAITGRFHELNVLTPVRDFPARHASTLLAFEAIVDAVSTLQKV